MNDTNKTETDGHGKSQALAQLESVREMVAALECDYGRLQELRDAVQPYAAGWNMAGYLPDVEPDAFDDADDARGALAESMRRHADDIDESRAAAADVLRACADALEAGTGEKYAAEFGQTIDGLHYWIAYDPSPTAGLDPDEAEELRELIEAAGDCEDEEEARQRIEEDALSVEVRCSQWRLVGDTEDAPDEFCITLCTGGPHVQIRGELRNGSPHRAWLEYQDWGTPMQELSESWGDDALLAYASVFYFGE